MLQIMPMVIKDRWLRFLIWQSLISSSIFVLYKIIILSPFVEHPLLPSFFGLIYFFIFNLSLLLFSFSLFLISSPRRDRAASISELISRFCQGILKFVALGSKELFDADFRRRAQKSISFAVFMVFCSLSGFLAAVAIFGNLEGLHGRRVTSLWLRGAVFGMVYGFHYLHKRRWVFVFPIIQRPLYFSFKMGLYPSMTQAATLASLSYLFAFILTLFVPDDLKSRRTFGQLIIQNIILFLGTSLIAFFWELTSHSLGVLHTKRHVFALPQGSSAAGTNPNDLLLLALEQSIPRSLCQYLAYLDLCMVCECNVNDWRRGAFFEETGETYKRLVSLCLRPLEVLTSRLAECLEGKASRKANLISQPFRLSFNADMDHKLHEAFDDFQLYAWCARSVSALTARSHNEDKFGVAQLTGSNASVMSTLLSCLSAVEACLGKKIISQSSHLAGPGAIKWASSGGLKRVNRLSIADRRKSLSLYCKVYAMADILKTSVYQITSVFEDELRGTVRASSILKEWITKNRILYGSPEALVQKLNLFVEFVC